MANSDVKLRVEILADGRTVVRAFDQTATASRKAASQVEGDARKQKRALETVELTAHRTRGAISMLAGSFGLAGLGFGIAEVVKRGEDLQSQQARLQTALRNTGQFSRDSMESLTRSAEGLATHGGFADPEDLQALSQFVTVTGSATKAQSDLGLATDVARGTHKDLLQVTRAIALAEAGRTTGLSRLGIAMAKGTTAQQALAILQQRYAGQTAAYSRTTAGEVSNAQNAIESASARIGRAILPMVATIAEKIASVIDYFGTHKNELIAFGTAFGVMVGMFTFTKVVEGFHAAAAAVVVFSGAEEGATLATIAWGAAMRATIIGIVITAIYLLITHWKQVTQAFQATIDWLRHNWPMVAGLLLAPVTLGLSAVVGAVVTHMGTVKRIFGTVTHAIAAPFQAGWRIIRDVFNGILNDARWLVHHVKSALNTLGFGGSGVASYINPIGLGGHILHGLSSLLPHTGGLVPQHFAMGGGVGPMGTDIIPAFLTPGEFVIRRQAVESIGAQNLNAMNATGTVAGPGQQPDWVYVTAPIQLVQGGRVAAEATVHTAARRAALAGSLAMVG